jgi:hypothetical protein
MPESWPALLRASKRALALSKATGTPFYVIRNGKTVDLNSAASKRPIKKKKARP